MIKTGDIYANSYLWFDGYDPFFELDWFYPAREIST